MHDFNFTAEFINQNTIKSNRIYGTAIFERGGIEIIANEKTRIEAWIGGLDGKVIEGGGSRRRVEFENDDSGLKWNCTGNPKNHQIFCKHCVALALYLDQVSNESEVQLNKFMQVQQFSIKINAPKQRVWDTLWSDKTFRQWANIIDEGTYMKGELKEGNQIEFISGNGFGVTSLVEKLIPSQLLVIKHKADTQDVGQRARQDQWTGGKEIYTLKEMDSITTLTAEFDVPPELEDYFKETYPKAFEMVKVIAEQVQ